ncbi:histidine phosphatase family protein [Paracoccus laeviglucosivorans]|uniref:Probable phosphoglycerate mutase n=1 Tax=Paracoccus laeviglucosivorans TaxID=1197861 RepID=A0A521D4T4_9RHOB|nr:histidine phosphatase family protein [Paracoccus laeviglucosivorans]SMO66698.1 probable phosphoglycerate mutase [Paracoccus laeviglucosivorans]
MGLNLPALYVLRHGQTEWNLAGRFQGRSDSPLTALGRAQAGRQAELVAALPDDLLRFSSPAGRAVETARIVFRGRAFMQDDRLHEIDVGDFTGSSEADLRAAHPAIFADGGIGWYDRTPNGEGFAALEARVRDFLADLDGPAVIVTHGITLRMICALVMGLPAARMAEIEMTQGALHHIGAGTHRITL